ncbi:RICIN domain-containing protein [Streptomyces zagrosensis]|uniref:Ricin B lectin domain-containing protein n=1 Tax=Streptomyces zagrosensis TaxID=1042984 RepID=A0A7W9V176_9ACTN|nr:RICIN domain-containing protein [Streptomyces zagrosensis]MBB5938895.1 hypothetical protein [Streptomyces zagrosensis]
MRVHTKTLRWLSIAAVTAATTTGGMSATVHAVEVSAPPSGETRIKTFNGDIDMCIAVKGVTDDSDDGALAIQQPCSRAANQKFTFVPASDGRYEIRTSARKCLDVANASSDDRTPIIQYRCEGSANQKFRVESSSGAVRMRAFANKKCLDVKNNNEDPGARIIQYKCLNQRNQQFRFA